MAEEIQEAVQIIRVAYDGIDIAVKIGSGMIGQIKEALDFMVALLEHEKVMGKENIKKLLMKGGDLQVLQFATEDMGKVKKLAKKYGLLYSALPDINKGDGMSEIIFHAEAVPRVNMMLQKLKTGRLASFDDYLKNGDEEERNRLLSLLKERKTEGREDCPQDYPRAGKGVEKESEENLIEQVGIYAAEKQKISVEDVKWKFGIGSMQTEYVLGTLEKMGIVEKEKDGKYRAAMDKDAFLDRIHGYQELAERMHMISATQDKNTLAITIERELVAEENDRAVKTRIPGTWGNDAMFLWVDKSKMIESRSGRAMLTLLDADKEYKLYSAENRVIGTKKGSKLYEGHYDQVEAEIRKRYEKAGRKAADFKKKIAAPKRR